MKILQTKREVFYWRNLPTTQLLLRLFSVTCWASSINCKGGWFRLFGYGLTWKHESEGLMFSERMGYTKYLRLGKWIVKPCR